jgi:hypothetical protein
VGLAVLEAAGYGALLGVLRLVERATGGWGIGLEFYRLDQLGASAGPLTYWLVYAIPVVAAAAAGALVGAVYARWAAPGVYALVLGVLALLGGAAAIVALLDGWAALEAWIAGLPPLALTTAAPLVLALLLGAASWMVLRRAAV